MDYYIIDYGLIIVATLIAMLAQFYIKHNYKKYSKKENTTGNTGYEAARKILDNNGLGHVGINMVKGELSDHYDPRNQTVNLSEAIYKNNSIAAVSVAAHECGHAIQDKDGYTFLRIRRSIIPVVNFASYGGYIAVAVGLLFSLPVLIKVGILLELIILFFQLVTLPVEFNASKRGMNQIRELGLLDNKEASGARKMLNSAALTYVAAVASAIINVLRLVLILNRRRD
jgi:hypothetical protein